MRTRLRLGAAAAVGLGALLLATVLASPALAWHSNVTVSARCLDGKVRIHYTVEAWKPGHDATVEVTYYLNGEQTTLESDEFYFGEHHKQFSDHFDLSADTTGTITFVVVAHWKDAEATTDEGSAKLPPAGKCEEQPTPSTPPSTTPESTPPPSVSPSTSEVTPSTEESAVGAGTSTTAPGQLPFTGTSSGPTLVTGILLLGGGALFLLLSRPKGRHLAR
jgi:hypothetical protein